MEYLENYSYLLMMIRPKKLFRRLVANKLVAYKDKKCTKLEMRTIGGNALTTIFWGWIIGDQVSSSKATNVIAVVGTKFKHAVVDTKLACTIHM